LREENSKDYFFLNQQDVSKNTMLKNNVPNACSVEDTFHPVSRGMSVTATLARSYTPGA
jgi:hypothetical protein